MSEQEVLSHLHALVTNGQYRQAEELLVNPAYIQMVHKSPTGRYLASVVAMRLGRAEDALALLSRDTRQDLNQQAGDTPLLSQTPTGNKRPTQLKSDLMNMTSLLDPPNITAAEGSKADLETVQPFNPQAWMMYMQGAAVIQLSNVGATETTPGIKQLLQQYPANSQLAASAAKGAQSTRLSGLDALAARIWTETVRLDPRCWEAWTGLRDHGLLTAEEETDLIYDVNWSQVCGPSAEFFQNYCLATQPYAKTNEQAIHSLLSRYPALINDPSLRTIHAARLLLLGQARSCLEHTTRALELRRVPDPSTTAVHITALTMLYAKNALFRIAHELAEEFGLSAIKRAETEPRDTGSGPASMVEGGQKPSFPLSTPRGSGVAAAVAGTGRLRSGARGLLVPETPSKTPGAFSAPMPTHSAYTTGSTGYVAARSVVQSAEATALAAWRGLWGLPTWTHAGPPVLATYSSALGPLQAVSAESSSLLNTLTTSSVQAVGYSTQYEFAGASLAWYAIGCYYLVSALLMATPEAVCHEWVMTANVTGNSMSERQSGMAGLASMRRSLPLSPEAERALEEARRWLAKTTLATPRSVVAWVAFAHTFIVSGEWEAATRALHTAVGLCGCDGVVHGGGRDTPAQTSNRPPHNAVRGTMLAHIPLSSLGGVYLQMGDLGMAESCFNASAQCLSEYSVSEWIAAWKPVVDAVKHSQALSWCLENKEIPEGAIYTASLSDAQLLNDLGAMHYSTNNLTHARLLFMLSLRALLAQADSKMDSLFIVSNKRTTKLPAETRACLALVKHNLGNTLRRLNEFSAALECLQAAYEHAPNEPAIWISLAFCRHSRAVAAYPDTAKCSDDLDQAIEMYHRILAEQPGDSATTDLLSLALEMSTCTHDVIPTAIDPLLPDESFAFALRDPDEIGLLALNSLAVDDSNEVQESDSSQQSEDSDEAMDIEEDTDSEL
ncbi:anaphase-promoting complex subunit Cut9 [Coemansia sp. RSA 990]|nr:anaphase-promoting complex subunit Cut9 [Coemansia sp. RSA 990]